MVENYIVEEAIEFCSEFIARVSSIGLNSSVIKKNSNVDRALSASSFIRPSEEQLDQAHLYVIQNVNDVLPYVEQHMESLRKLNSGKVRNKKWIQEEHNRKFSRWLSTWVALALEVPKNSITPSLRWVAHKPSPDVATYSGYIINGYYYHTKRRDDIRRVQNSGVSITATTMQVSSSKDKNHVMSDMTFYGVIREIWEIDYHQLSFILFKCDWVDNRSGVKVDELGFTIVDLKCIGHKSDSFILATQAKQVFYVQDSANSEWSVVLTYPQRTIEEDFFEDEIGDMLQECGYETIKRMPNVDTPNETDDTNSTYIRHDCEGRWVEKVRNITAIFMMEDKVRMKEKCFQKKFRTFKTTLTQKYILPSKDQPSLLQFPPKIYSHINQEDWESFVDARLSEEWEKEARKGRNNDYFDDATRDCASRIDELVATNKNEDILTDALGSKEHGGRVRGVGGFVSQSQYFNTIKGKEKMCYKEEDDSRCKSDKKRSNHSRSSIGSINIDLDADEDTPTNKGVEGTPCQLSIGSINNSVAVATIVEDNIGCPNVKVLVDVVTGENLTIPNPGKEKIETLNQALVFIGCCMLSIFVKIAFMFWTLFGRVEDMASETRSTTLSINSKMETCKGCRYYVQKYIHEIVYNSSTSITSLFNTKNPYRQEEIDEIRTEWAAFVSRLCVG
ncbi:transposase [Cucumis melo var. makuwa]|uniref:Transposase n=1 Tax=Cucumis melo var. makuwa TaxID=1194695 RepID=A0A5A7VJG6_CUCMM|nr:transposase [Cucumis melo var. makuwa]